MSRFFITKDAVDTANNRITITGEDVKHIRSVLRSEPGDRLELCDAVGTDYSAVVELVEKDRVMTRIEKKWFNRTESPLDITLFQGIPKADKMDLIIQKCVELGVNRFVPVMTSRTVIRFDSAKDSAAKSARWQRIALEAAKQCDRGIIPEVAEPVRLGEALKMAEGSLLRLIPYEEETDGGLRKLMEKAKMHWDTDRNSASDNAENASAFRRMKVSVFIGPEGGFAPEEVRKAVESGFVSVTLGPRILRTETAGIAVVSMLGYELGDMSGNPV